MPDEELQLSESRSYWLHALTPVHVGSGKGFGFIDLPIAREKVSNFPLIPGSAIKGVLSDQYDTDGSFRQISSSNANEMNFRRAFGSGGVGADNAGSIVFTDAHLICMPLRSLYGSFAWCTCPMVLRRLNRDLEHVARQATGLDVPHVSHAVDASTHSLLVPALLHQARSSLVDGDDLAYFDDFDFHAEENSSVAGWAELIASRVLDQSWYEIFAQRFAVISDDVFAFFAEMSTQVDARIRIDDNTKTVSPGALWYEESLPAESILSGIAWCGPIYGNGNRHDANARSALLNNYCHHPLTLQIGGKASVGRGQMNVRFNH